MGGTNVKVSLARAQGAAQDPLGPGDDRGEDGGGGQEGRPRGWKYDAVSIGYPGAGGERPARPTSPRTWAAGWVRFDYQKAFGKPVRVDQRRRHAGARQLRGRAHAVPGPRHRPRLGARGRRRRWRRWSWRTCPTATGGPTRTTWALRGYKRLGRKKWRGTSRRSWPCSSTGCRPTTWCWAAARPSKLKRCRRECGWATTPTRSSGGIRLWEDSEHSPAATAGPTWPARSASGASRGRASRRGRRRAAPPQRLGVLSVATRLYLVRHGATQLTAENRFSGAIGRRPLRRGPRAGAAPGASGSPTTRIAAVYCSPLSAAPSRPRRSWREPHGLTPIHRDGLREISHGRWEGLTRREVEDALPRRVRGLGGRPVHLRARGRRVGPGACSPARCP